MIAPHPTSAFSLVFWDWTGLISVLFAWSAISDEFLPDEVPKEFVQPMNNCTEK